MKTVINNLKKISLLILLAILAEKGSCQNHSFGEGTVNWEIRKPYVMPPDAEQYAGSDLVILSDFTEFFFFSEGNEKITRNIKYKINTDKGLKHLNHFKTPEAFDQGFDANLYKQSRRARIKTPYIKDYAVKLFAARKFSHGRWSPVNVKDTYEQIRWITSTGEFINEDLLILNMSSLSIGDVVEIYYEATFNSQYGNNLFYFNSIFPKLTCEYSFTYRTNSVFKDSCYIMPVNIDPMQISATRVDYKDYKLVTTKIKLNHLAANNYPLNSFESRKMPHVCADFIYYRSSVNFSNDQFSFVKAIKPKNFEWVVSFDTSTVDNTKIYDKQYAAVRKFIATLPPAGNDSQNVVFLHALCDTFNNYRYISSNHLFYNESNLYELYSGDHLLKRRLVGHSLDKLYMDILKSNKLFFYRVNVMDKRFGEHDKQYRAHRAYEHNLVAVPANNSYVYFMPRYSGIQYHLNELPFYYEGVLAGLTPMNFQPETKNKETKVFKIIKTHHGTYNENTRTENALVKINADSLNLNLSIKESLSGQFSTILRHLYLNEIIDSTISPHYFKRCTNKPNAGLQKVKLSSKISEFPYRYNFNCSAKINYKDSFEIPLKNWFSFPLSKSMLPETPNQDYYFDFDYSDSYNFLIEFNKGRSIINQEDFTKKISNAYFDLESSMVKNSQTAYLLKVALTVKTNSIPVADIQLLMQLVDELDKLNNLKLELARKN